MADRAESGSDTEDSNAPERTLSHITPPAAPQGGESDDGLSEGDLGEVLEALSPAAVKYKFIGLRLGVKRNEIEKIEMQYPAPNDRLCEVLSYCLKHLSALTWRDIDNALTSQSVNEEHLAQQLRETYGQMQSTQKKLMQKGDGAIGRSKKKKYRNEMYPQKVVLQHEKESASASNMETVSDFAKQHKVAGQSEVSRIGSSSTSLSSDDESSVTVRGHEMAAQKKGKGKAPLHDTELSKRILNNSDKKCKGEKTTPKMTVHVKMKSKGRANQGVPWSRKQSRTPQVSQAEQSELPDTETTSTVKNMEQELLSGDQEYEERIKTKKRRKTNGIKRKSDRKDKREHHMELQTDNQTAVIDSSSVEDLSSDEKAVDEVKQKTREEQCQYRKREKVAEEEKHMEHSKPMNVTHIEDTREREILHSKKRRKRECLENNAATCLVPPSAQGEFPASQKKSAYLSSSSEDEDGSMDENTNVKGLKKKSHKHHNGSSVSSTDSTAIASSETSSESKRRKQQPSSRRKVKKTSKIKVSKCRKKKGRGTEKSIVSNSSECDSPPQEQCKLSKDDCKNLKSIFRCHFGKLCIAINEPLELAVHLREKGLISSSMMDKMVSSPYSRQEKTIHLVHALDRRIKSNPNHLLVFIEILLQNVVLRDIGRTLWKKTGKYTHTCIPVHD